MQKFSLILLLLLLFLHFLPQQTKGSHIVGGEVYYECLGNDNYLVTIKIYRDCFLGLAPFDNPLSLGVYDAAGNLEKNVLIPFPGAQIIPPETSDPCLQVPLDICVEEAVYQTTINLPPQAGGYTLVHQRCCRNNTIVNIVDPGAAGSTYTAHIPGTEVVTCNSSPYFNEFPPIVVCAGSPLVFDHSATDPDGDQLIYEFCDPLVGGTEFNPMPIPPFGPPFSAVTWNSGFSAGFPMTASPPLEINPQTGLITGTPNMLGQYVIGVCVREYRNGEFVGKTIRDFQFNVTDCVSNVVAEIPVIDTSEAASKGTQGVYIIQCNDYEVAFTNLSQNAETYFWDFGDGFTSTDFEPLHTFQDTGTYFVTLVANPGSFCTDTFDVVVEIYPFFESDFVTESVCAGDTIFFEDLSTSSFNDISGWEWDFGDGNGSQTQNPFHVYSEGGLYNISLSSSSDKGCFDNVQKQIEIYVPPDISYQNPPFCLGDTVEFLSVLEPNADSITDAFWTYNGNQVSTPMIEVDFPQVGSYDLFFYAENSHGCSKNDTLQIVVEPLPTADAGPDAVMCLGDSVLLEGSGSVFFEWNPVDFVSDPDSAMTFASPTESLWLELRVFDQNGCEDTDSLFVTVHPLPDITLTPDTSICLGDTIMVEASGGIAYNWEFDQANNTQINQESVLAFPLISTDYIVEAENTFGCKKSDTTTIDIIYPLSSTGITEVEACIGDTILLSATEAELYQWSSEDNLSVSGNQQDFALEVFMDEVIYVERANICFSTSDTFHLTANTSPEIFTNETEFEIFLNESVELSIIIDDGFEIAWEPPIHLDCINCPDVVSTPEADIDYKVIVTTENSCIDSAFFRISVIDFCDDLIFIPNMFSPNGDGVNDVFYVRSYFPVRLEYFRVFDRWGKLKFESSVLSNGWDGIGLNGQEAESGVYAYVVSYICPIDGNTQIERGNVTLIR